MICPRGSGPCCPRGTARFAPKKPARLAPESVDDYLGMRNTQRSYRYTSLCVKVCRQRARNPRASQAGIRSSLREWKRHKWEGMSKVYWGRDT